MIIGLTGAKGSGKDLFYTIANTQYPHLDIRKIAYADPIKEQIMNIFELQSELEYDAFKRSTVNYTLHSGQNTPATVAGRRLVREIGMLMRSYDVNQFTQYVEDKIAEAPRATWIITDLRFDNEVSSIKKLGGLIIKIKREGYGYDGHVTETEISDDLCSSVIHNDGHWPTYAEAVRSTFGNILQTLSVIKEKV